MSEMFNTHHESSSRLIGMNNIRNYLYGGKGIVTLESPTGKYHTYAFERPKKKNVFDPSVLFVHVKIDSGYWRYIGMVNSYGFHTTAKSEMSINSDEVRGAKYIVSMSRYEGESPMKLYHEGVCAVCGRKLTTPKSIARGVGPRCAKILEGLDV